MKPVVCIPFAWYCAWLSENKEPVWEQYEECHPATKQWDNFPDKIIPLYTHPVKELTDEEITEIFDTTFEVRDYEDSFIKFARAILRKAQEK